MLDRLLIRKLYHRHQLIHNYIFESEFIQHYHCVKHDSFGYSDACL